MYRYVPYNPQPAMEEMIYMHRYCTKLKKNNTYEKRVTWLEPLHGLDTPQIAVDEYKSQFPGHIPHGNSSKTNDFYIRIPVSTITEIGKRVGNKAPKQLYDEMLLEGNIDTFPRDSKQIRAKKYNDKRRRRIDKDEHLYRQNLAESVLAIMNMAQDHNSYVKSAIVDEKKVQCIILYNDRQITEIKQFCLIGKERRVWSFDKTYTLGELYVTPSVYTNCALLRAKKDNDSENVLFLGPLFIHANSDAEPYSRFFDHLSACLMKGDTHQLILGSDEEFSMRQAMSTSFQMHQ